LALVAVLVCLGVLGWLVEALTVRPLIARGASITSPILALLGVLVIFRESLTMLFGADPLPSPPPFGFRRVAFGLFAGVPPQFLIIALTIAPFTAACLFFSAGLGTRLQAVALNRRAAALMGINLRRVTTFAFVSGAMVAGSRPADEPAHVGAPRWACRSRSGLPALVAASAGSKVRCSAVWCLPLSNSSARAICGSHRADTRLPVRAADPVSVPAPSVSFLHARRVDAAGARRFDLVGCDHRRFGPGLLARRLRD
jgi:hypothetical protein